MKFGSQKKSGEYSNNGALELTSSLLMADSAWELGNISMGNFAGGLGHVRTQAPTATSYRHPYLYIWAIRHSPIQESRRL